MDIGKLIAWIISIALVLGTAGTLSEITASLRSEAVKAHQTGMISLRDFNRRLHRGH